MRLTLATLVAAAAALHAGCAGEPAPLDDAEVALPATAPVKIILDTDMASDCDDAGALGMLHAFADNGEAQIVGVMVSTGGDYGAPAADVINTFYGRPDIPIGTTRRADFWIQKGTNPSQAYDYEVFNKHLAQNFPSSLRSGDDAPDAVQLYRQLLAQAADQSVVIVTLGPLINVEQLLRSPADSFSSLAGVDLIKKKVKSLVVTGGNNPSGTSSNFSKEDAEIYLSPLVQGRPGDATTSWPGRIVWVGNNTGSSVNTGYSTNALPSSVHPIRKAYELFFKANGGGPRRQSYDQAGVYIAVRGTSDGLFSLVETGYQTMASVSAGETRWSAVSADPLGLPAGRRDHAYSTRVATTTSVAAAFQALMDQPPASTEPPAGGLDPDALVLEAEAAAGQPAFAPFRVVASATEGGGAYIDTAAGAGDHKSAPPASGGRAAYALTAKVGGPHAIWLRVRAVQGGTYDSFYGRVGGGSLEVVNQFPSDQSFEWVRYRDVDLGAAGATTTLEIVLREERTKLDQILVTPDLAFTPSGAL